MAKRKDKFIDENLKILADEVIDECGRQTIKRLKIPTYIVSNLSKNLREYQENALKNFYALGQCDSYCDSYKDSRHLMFNMATGSGKTLVMSAIILEMYKRGYRNFIFFVNSTSILEKTKANFCDKSSSKYLFGSEILIDNKRVEINAISSLNDSRQNAINIYFSTIQGLFSLFNNERENGITYDDLKAEKIVFLADEAHHLNADTAKQKSEDEKSGWEGVIKNAFNSNTQNYLFEFSATVPRQREILDKYRDKIIYKYDLKSFCDAGFSKRIFLMKYESDDLAQRMLGGVILSVFRQYIASQNSINLKPVIMYKSETISASKENEVKFNDLIKGLKYSDITDFFNNANGMFFCNAREFFSEKFGDKWEISLCNVIKNSFTSHRILNVNNDGEAGKNQILLNTLEDENNDIRVIFAVDKLNEGWDVLNLFDIVRLGSAKNSGSVTTKEAQLIGRGARYFPFITNDFKGDEWKYKRKFDSNLFTDTNLSHLERLSYHTVNDVDFITNLNKTMKENGLFIELEEKRVLLNPSKKAKEITAKNKIFYIKNEKIKRDFNLFSADLQAHGENLKARIGKLKVPLFSYKILEFEVFKDEMDSDELLKLNNFKNRIEYSIFLKAMNSVGLKFSDICRNFSVKSKREFYENLGQINLLFHKRQDFESVKNRFEIAKFILSNLNKIIYDEKNEYDVSEFKILKLENTGVRAIISNDDKIKSSQYDWLYYDKMSLDSELEAKFLAFIEANKSKIDTKFSEWIVFRNDGFSEFKMYNNDINSEYYGVGFEPDFILFGKNGDDEVLNVECFLEPKGKHLAGNEKMRGQDTWKEEFLSELNNRFFSDRNNQIKTISLPFFTDINDTKFEEKFDALFE